jgi:glycogen phosphorylase
MSASMSEPDNHQGSFPTAESGFSRYAPGGASGILSNEEASTRRLVDAFFLSRAHDHHAGKSMFNASPQLPQPLLPLLELALDLRWTWSHAGDALWRRIDAELWGRTGNPWLMLQLLPASRLAALAADTDFLDDLRTRLADRERLLSSPGWFAESDHSRGLGRVAYFSMEFGLHEALPLFAGGLGVLAGDHLKTASDLDVPIVGVGILWQQGYFRQIVNGDGQQHEVYPFNDPATLPIQRVLNSTDEPLNVLLELPGRLLRLRVWRVVVGRAHLYLLDSNHPLNAPADRALTGALYGGDPPVRFYQNLILGIGGWRLLEALGIEVEICHLNEGHAAFVVVERARSFMQKHGVSFREALWATRAGNIFTTHTAVAAGFDTFGPELIAHYAPFFEPYVRQLGLEWPEVLALGRSNLADPREAFNVASLALRGCSRANAVSRLHGEVSRGLFRSLFPRWPEAEVPIGHVTNGVHVPSWDSVGADAIWTAAGGKDRWRGGLEDLEAAIGECSDEQLWAMRSWERADLVRYARRRVRRQLGQRGIGGDVFSAQEVLDPDALTLGFARRFAAYKRPNLLLADPDRLQRLLTDAARPVQIVVAGKAHPADHQGKHLIAGWAHFASLPQVRHHVVFLEDYDMTLAKELVQGVDLWINTPQRPWEACGTSGMKVLVNGGLNLSTLDGWWDEAYRPDLGWALDAGITFDHARDYAAEAVELYRILEEQVVSEFYDRDAQGLPRRWLQRMRTSMAELAPRFSSNRMLREYVEQLYLPAAADLRERVAERARIARELAVWEARLAAHWSDVRFTAVEVTSEDGVLHARVELALGRLQPEEVQVQLYADPLGEEPMRVVPLACDGVSAPSHSTFRFNAALCTESSAADFTARAIPYHRCARIPLELPLICWAR